MTCGGVGVRISVEPGTPCTPTFSAASRAEILSPMTSMAAGGGPMKVTPSDR